MRITPFIRHWTWLNDMEPACICCMSCRQRNNLTDALADHPEARKDNPDDGETIEQAKQKLIDRYLHRLGGYSHYEFQVLKGVPIVEIVRFARLQEVDLIVLGAAGSSKSNKLHFGSTAENVARRAQCTVMCIRNPKR